MSVRTSNLFRKARRVLRQAGLTLTWGHDEPAVLDHSRMTAAMDRQIEQYMAEMDAAMQRAEDEFMRPYREFEQQKYGGNPPSLVGYGGQLELDVSHNQDQRDLFAGVGR